ncbi:type II toxin-antitoxin system VapC family toxin [Bradyrhizobium symbiodeficiens]|uniref:type II toxin-antitoxin system VapC family toxin n=1 Tax=Bradyrhizobium symbiodeficiens TaxID=1404367 RepID=UPI0030CD4533
MIAIDTNLIVRYLTGDHATQSARARALIDGERVFVAVTVLLEVEWVLRSAYGYQAAAVVHALRVFAGLPTVTIEDGATVAAALDLVERGMDFVDSLHLTRSEHCEAFVTFDRKLVKAAKKAGHEGVREVW